LELNELVEKSQKYYGLEIDSIERIKNAYKILSHGKAYCLKLVKYNYGHSLFIISAMQYLTERGFDKIPQIIKTQNGKDYISVGNCYAYLTEWIVSRQCNFDNPLDISMASSKLAELHKKSEGFTITTEMEPRVGWFKWVETFNTRGDEILDFKHRIKNKASKSEFDCIYLENVENEENRARVSAQDLINSEYFNKMSIEVTKNGFCHHDFAHHNVLIQDDGSVNVIDFDYCILDTHLHDLASLLIRRMKNGKWDLSCANYVLQAYNSCYKLVQSDTPVMAALMEFPQDFWQIGIQYYWEKQKWGEDFFINKLNKIIEDRDERQEFIENFKLVRL
jgi:CotS family spore coat protein